METKICKECGRELPIKEFRITKGGSRMNTCNQCFNAKRNETHEMKRMEIERQREMYAQEFEGKQPVDVLQLMGRAKKWLEARGYEIVLRGTLMVKKDVKFD